MLKGVWHLALPWVMPIFTAVALFVPSEGTGAGSDMLVSAAMLLPGADILLPLAVGALLGFVPGGPPDVWWLGLSALGAASASSAITAVVLGGVSASDFVVVALQAAVLVAVASLVRSIRGRPIRRE